MAEFENHIDTSDIVGLTHRSVHGAAATAGGQVVKFALQFLSQVWLARLISPAEYGLIAMVAPIMSFIAIIGDMGIGMALVQQKSVSQSQISALFWLNTALSVAVSSVLIVNFSCSGMALSRAENHHNHHSTCTLVFRRHFGYPSRGALESRNATQSARGHRVYPVGDWSGRRRSDREGRVWLLVAGIHANGEYRKRRLDGVVERGLAAFPTALGPISEPNPCDLEQASRLVTLQCTSTCQPTT